MKILVDTCHFIWFAANDSRLPARDKAALEDASNEVYLSVVSFWEIVIKHGIGKLTLPGDPKDYVPTRCADLSIVLLPLGRRPLQQLGSLPRIHGDPFDRVLVAVALEYGLQLSSCDAEIRKYPVPLL